MRPRLVLPVAALLLAAPPAPAAHRKAPLRIDLTSASERPATYRAFTAAGELSRVVPSGPPKDPRLWAPGVRQVGLVIPVARGDTLGGASPATFFGDATAGPLVFVATGREEIRVAVRQTDRAFPIASAQGRRLVVRRVGDFASVTRE